MLFWRSVTESETKPLRPPLQNLASVALKLRCQIECQLRHQGRADIQAVAHGGVRAEAGSPEELQPMGRTHAEAGEKCEEGRAAERSCYGLIVSSRVPPAAWPGKGGRGVGNEGVKKETDPEQRERSEQSVQRWQLNLFCR